MKKKVCVIIPCYNVRHKIIEVLNSHFLKKVDKIILVDDKCPQKTGNFLKKKISKNKKVKIILHKKNLGVGGAVISGYNYALKNKFNVIIKVDGDGQHDISIISNFIKNLITDNYQMCKGYRDLSLKFFNKKNRMPLIRLIGAKSLEYMMKINTRNWYLKDPCHGFFGVNDKILKKINLSEIKKNYFFEQDMIFNVIKHGGQIKHFKNEVYYGDESSNLNPIMSIPIFFYYHVCKFLLNFFKK